MKIKTEDTVRIYCSQDVAQPTNKSSLNCPPINDSEYLSENDIYCGDARTLLTRVRPNSVALSFWSPPYFVGKSYEKDLTFEDWQTLLAKVINLHFPIIKPGGFLAINIADILAFADPTMPRIQADNVTTKRCVVSKEQVLAAAREHPDYNRYKLARLLRCSEQTIQRRMEHNNVRGGKYEIQTKVKLVGGLIEAWGNNAGFYLYDRRIWAKDPCWENSRWHSLSYRSVDEFEYIYVFWKPGITTVDRNRLTRKEWSEWGSRGVWHFSQVRSHARHEAEFPIELPKRVIRLFSTHDDLVLDCFIGSGTTAVAAIGQNRRYLGFDSIPEYVSQAKQRCFAAQLGATE
jgi:DNA modification methylase